MGTIPPKIPKQKLNVNERIVHRVFAFRISIKRPGVVAAFNVVNIAKQNRSG